MFRKTLPQLHLIVVTALALAATSVSAAPRKPVGSTIPGAVAATIIRVIDGDTVVVDALTWPGHSVRVSVRLAGIDAPEIRSHCPAIKAAGYRAKARLAGLVENTDSVELRDIRGGKYYGRVLAAMTVANRDVSEILLADGLVQPYSGGRRARLPCP